MVHTQAQKVVALVNPQAIKNNASYTVTELDTQGFRYVDFYFMLGATDIALSALKVQETDTSGSGYADVTGADFSVSPATLPSATDDNNVFAIRLDLTRARKRFFKPVITVGSGTSGGFVVAWAVLSRAEQLPDTASDRGVTQELIV